MNKLNIKSNLKTRQGITRLNFIKNYLTKTNIQCFVKKYVCLIILFLSTILSFETYANIRTCNEAITESNILSVHSKRYVVNRQPYYNFLKLRTWPLINKYFENIFDNTHRIKTAQINGNIQVRQNNFHLTSQIEYNFKLYKDLKIAKKGQANNIKINFPKVDSHLKNFNGIVDKQILRGEVEASGAIHLGFIFVNDNGRFITLKYLDEIPEGFYLMQYRDNAVPSGDILWRSIKNGIFPITNTLILHDLYGHPIGYLIMPEYASSYRKLASYLVDEAKKYNLSEYRYLKRDKLDKHRLRVSFFNEDFFLIKQKELFRFFEFHGLTLTTTNHNNKEIIEIFQAKLSSFDRSIFFDNLKTYFYTIMTPLGGALADFIERPNNLFDIFFKNPESSENLESIDEIIWILYQFSNLGLEDWLEATMKPHIDTSSKIYKTLCNEIRPNISDPLANQLNYILKPFCN